MKMMDVFRKDTKKGFTLVELLIVIVILGILAAVVIAKFAGASKDSKESSLKGNLAGLRRQLELSKIKSTDGATYPTTLATMVPTYIERVPYEPFMNVNTEVAAYNAAGGWIYDSTVGQVQVNVPTTGTPNDTTWGLLYSEW